MYTLELGPWKGLPLAQTVGVMKRIIIVIALFTSACGGNPSAPTSAAVPVVSAVQPAPVPPVDEPAPPVVEPPAAPTPAPVPDPAPPPAPARELYNGTTAGGHWYGAARVPDRFTLEVTAEALVVEGVSFPILSRSDGITTAGTAGVESLTIRSTDGAWSWTYNGLPGQAFGALERR